ncbi:cysteine desulfurase [Candidatus Falkowbacteria bacterium]|nr:cysteine desulfurase [Candidatus Falkowbacteria bacterium]
MSKIKEQIYFDYAATTPIDPRVKRVMEPYLDDKFANASSVHSMGQDSANAVLKARDTIAGFLNCKANEVVFTSGATECNNTVFKGVSEAMKEYGNHIITTKIEHPCVLESCKYLEKRGFKVTYLPVGSNGVVKVSDVEKALTKKTILVSIMYVNNEVGTIQPIADIGKLIKSFRSLSSVPRFPIFHTDAAQAVNYLDCDVDKLGVDLMSLSGHKIYGPKGVGALYIRKGTLIEPLMHGGRQEDGMRAGTLNTPGIVGMGSAIQEIKKTTLRQAQGGENQENKRIKFLRDELINKILKTIPNSKLNGDKKLRVANNVNVSFKGVEGESLLMLLDGEGIAVSTGSACASGSIKPSHVLMALGRGPLESHGSIRITIGRFTKESDIKKLLAVLLKAVKRLREISFF